jgi:hypothetical protein
MGFKRLSSLVPVHDFTKEPLFIGAYVRTDMIECDVTKSEGGGKKRKTVKAREERPFHVFKACSVPSGGEPKTRGDLHISEDERGIWGAAVIDTMIEGDEKRGKEPAKPGDIFRVIRHPEKKKGKNGFLYFNYECDRWEDEA